MKRRHAIGTIGSIAMAAVAGCAGDDHSNSEDQLSFFEENLSEEGIDVLDVTKEGQNVVLRYQTDRVTDQGLGDEIGTISASYVLAKNNGLDASRLNATINDGDEDVATWHVREEWVEQFEAGEIEPDEFTTKVLNTAELIDS